MMADKRLASLLASLDDEWHAFVRNCLKKERVVLETVRFNQFIREIKKSIAVLYATTPKRRPRNARGGRRRPFRDAHNALRELWILSHNDALPIEVLRIEVLRTLQDLPRAAVEYLDRRAPNVIPRLFPDEQQVTRFHDWAARADGEKLKVATGVLSADGAQIVEGRSRGGGRRSGRRLEPIIMGEARGAGTRVHRGGRPINEGDQTFVMHLALAWLHATGIAPTPGRSDHTGFGDLVYAIFQLLEQPDESATYALRRYWEEVEKGKARKSLDNF
jgi:hypothetical protein